jgi:hypothetical protein
MARQLDPIKRGLAVAIQHYMLTQDRPALLPTPDNVESIEVTAVSPTETQVRVKTTDEGTRYFTIKLSEQMLQRLYSFFRPYRRVGPTVRINELSTPGGTMSSPSRDSGNGWLLLIILAALALGGGGAKASTTQPTNPHYVVPSCTGLANVPGYNQCHK